MPHYFRLQSNRLFVGILVITASFFSGCVSSHFRVEKLQSSARIDHNQRFAILPLSYKAAPRTGTLHEWLIRESVYQTAYEQLETMGFNVVSWEELEHHLQPLYILPLKTEIIDNSILESESFLEVMKSELKVDAIMIIEVLQWSTRKLFGSHLIMIVDIYDLDQRQYKWSWNVDIKQPELFLLFRLDVNEPYQPQHNQEFLRKSFFEIVSSFN